jgi:hypothetical protein
MAKNLYGDSVVQNQRVSPAQIEKIRYLDDFDLIMLISEIHDHGWPMARKTLDLMPRGERDPKKKEGTR